MSPTIKTFLDRFGAESKSDDSPSETTTGIRQKRAKYLSRLEVAVDDAKRRADSGEWEKSRGATFVGLYAFCHRLVYGILPSELEQSGTFAMAAKHAARCAHELFEDDASRVASFIRWSWEREKGRAAWAHSKAIDRNRMGWRAQFSRALVTDYLVARAKRQ